MPDLSLPSARGGDTPLDLAGIGIGPFNLSVAALLDGIADVRARFFDKEAAFSWHPGMMFADVELQSSFLKDLVTPVQPTNPWSFIAYLVAHRRLFTFLNAQYEGIPRQEMANYFAWVAENLPGLTHNAHVREVEFDGTMFRLAFDNGVVRARNIAVGTGSRPFVPDWARPLMGNRCFHCSEALWRLDGLDARRIVVVGGGQSGGEVVEHLLSKDRLPVDLKWLSRRHNFEPINETPFSNQVFSPEYVEAYRRLSEDRKAAALDNSILTSDGLSLSTINSIYRKLYRIRHIDRLETEVSMQPGRNVVQVDRQQDEYRLIVRNAFDGGIEVIHADEIVLATGFRFELPEALAPLSGRLHRDRQNRVVPDDDYALHWDGPPQARIFAQNAGRYSHGIADSQLSLMAWRSARIVNALLGRQQFDLSLPDPVLDWPTAPSASNAVRLEAAQ
ncbi:lysine N(6)-hydroxylase/L-ornithine N(5)-oxygenase family protein [Roseibium salinum]|uniref:SidA/IucD/PvdA family monooxygenase n=1 Tax=Roseibium salinum TaxID=1604349 RepID=A0ABT3QWW1_9HYPH|nr:SidA/IucD/PvdA family monooxygenase [Roseibium sp. DSM 29163]MCX2721428.1 SidA/IucD/PvdA family monooxygenase [Roseibium sp. DSM 29163]